MQIRFDGWVLRTDTGELARGEDRTRLQDKPLRILIELLGHPNELVTRERLIALLWPTGVVEYDMALNAAVRRLRAALHDEADTPRYIETVPRKGYRFIGRLEPEAPAPAESTGTVPTGPTMRRRVLAYVVGGIGAIAITGAELVFRGDDATEPSSHALLPVRGETRELYARGRRLLANMKTPDTESAIAIFGRVTTLEPAFVRGYSAYGMALAQSAYDGAPDGAELMRKAGKAFDHALELDPELGEAWIGRALGTEDPAKAEAAFREGMRVDPEYSLAAWYFATFLSIHGRRGEALQLNDEALRKDPRSPHLLTQKAFFVMVNDTDLAKSMRLLRAALESNPDFFPALLDLASQAWFFAGEFAEAIRLAEHALALDPPSDEVRNLLGVMYLDVDDPDTAAALLRDSFRTTPARVSLAQYRRDARSAAAIATSAAGDPYRWILNSLSPMAEALRDSAIDRGQAAVALKTFAVVKAHWKAMAPTAYRAFSAVYAHALALAGETREAREMAQSLLTLLDGEAAGRPPFWFGRERAAAFMVLGQDELALLELGGNQKLRHFVRWWYTGSRDPLYARLHSNARFQELVAVAEAHRREQRARLEELRRSGAVPAHRAVPVD